MITWLKRGLLVSTAIVTLGLIAPPDIGRDAQAAALPKSESTNTEKPYIYKVDSNSYALYEAVLPVQTDDYIHRGDAATLNAFADTVIEQTYEQSLLKFGDVIAAKIGQTFEAEILTRLKDVIIHETEGLSMDQLQSLTLSDDPSAGLGEKIIHLYDTSTGQDLLRFHVRRDQPPKQGYWFNFHYHSDKDAFEGHHELGSIYWGKNMPPYWMA
ncbi:YpjP family protein [Halalkalibacterium ligniniphilum]|uniref:YpjP family protein n=1 Tax=Halalkalibacterium ligniniphilum TaxID=1134413 RepID=UPI000349F451|nr:YpjP family protein [Halalkalibacterium ligniniphilum]